MLNGKILFGLGLIILFSVLSLNINSKKETNTAPKETQMEDKTKVKYPEDYTLVLLGDSMTQNLGNSDEIKTYLKKYYPGKTFEVLNYGFGATNILSVEKRLNEKTFYGREFRPILDIDFDIILIESFGYNPLSEFPLDEGIKKQTEALDKIVAQIKQENPKAKIVFVATIAPNKRLFAKGQVELSPEEREKWANERIAYIKNHINYALSKNIPLINIYEASLEQDGNGKLDYINTADYIHPSPNGIRFISKKIADFLFKNNIIE